jgi:hypothetical protein
MIVTLKPIADASLYERFPTLNTGLDEILEVGKVKRQGDDNSVYNGNADVVSIIQFDTSEYNSWGVSSSLFLNFKIAIASTLPRNQRILAYPYTGSWEEGTGYFIQQPYNAENGIVWNDIGPTFRDTEYSASATLSGFPLEDFKINITNFESLISSSALTGIIIALPLEDSNNVENTTNIKVFSAQTHTIYEPTLTVIWDDQVFATGSLKALPSNEVEIAFQNIKQHYVYGSKQIVKLVVRDKYPLHGFNAVARYDNRYHLPETSYFRVRDVAADTLISDFSDGTKISCANNTNYFMLDTTPLYRGRYYRVEFKIVKSNGEILLFSPPETFVVR